MQMNTVELNIDKYESMLKEIGVLKTENEELKKRLQTSHNSDYMKCLDDIWDIVSVNLRSGKWDKSEFGEILKKHFA